MPSISINNIAAVVTIYRQYGDVGAYIYNGGPEEVYYRLGSDASINMLLADRTKTLVNNTSGFTVNITSSSNGGGDFVFPSGTFIKTIAIPKK